MRRDRPQECHTRPLRPRSRVLLRASILAKIAERRRLEDDPSVGASIERQIIERELAELEAAEPELLYREASRHDCQGKTLTDSNAQPLAEKALANLDDVI